MPEFGAGSQTFNPVFGATLQPVRPTKTCGGSSGGAAVALACGMIPIADGSDMGGSLRNPAGFCNVVGLRLSPAACRWPDANRLVYASGDGPMARTVADVALLLSAIAGPDRRSPIAIAEPAAAFARRARARLQRRAHRLEPRSRRPADRPAGTAAVDAQRKIFEDDWHASWSRPSRISRGRTTSLKSYARGHSTSSHGELIRTHRDASKTR